MNLKQKIILLLGITVIVNMGIYPPWCFYDIETGRYFRGFGYAFFATPPIPQELGRTTQFYTERICADIDYTRLAFQWSMVAISTGGFLLILKDKKKLQCGDDMPTNLQ